MSAAMRMLFGTDPGALETAARTEYVAALHAAQRTRDPGRVLWISPTARSRRSVLKRLTAEAGPVCVAAGVVTFEQFAESLLKAAAQPATAISSMVRRLILRRLVREALATDELPYFSRVAHTAGFLDIVEGFIRELKRDEIWPERFLELCDRHSATAVRDREIGRLYLRYQDVLHRQNWYDTEGRFWLARTVFLEGQCRRLPEWTQIAVVGFADFTPPQFDILEGLSRRSHHLLLTIPADPDDDRRELFARPNHTAELCRQRFPQVDVKHIHGLTDQHAGRTVLRDRIFGNLRQQTPASDPTGIDIVAANSPDSELSAVALRIKALLAAGSSPQDIVVGVSADSLHWTEGLRQRGLPAWCDTGPPVREAGLVKFLMAILLAELEDWPFARLQAVINSSYFRPINEFANDSRSVASSLRRLRLSSDRKAILQVLPIHDANSPSVEPDSDDETKLARDLHWPAVHAAAGRFLRWYSRVTEPLRTPRAFGGWIDVLAELVRHCGALPQTPVEPLDVADLVLWDRLQSTLRDAAAAEAKLTTSPPAMDLAEFVAEFRDLLVREARDPEPEAPGVVRVLDVEQVRHLDVPVLFLVGLTEDNFPSRRGDDCLFPDAERRRLSAAGLSMRHTQLDHQDDLFLFQTLLLQWRQRLVLTYAAVNQRGHPAFPSPYLTALRALFTQESLPIAVEGQLDPIPDPAHMLTSADQRLAAWDAARTGNPGWLRALWEQPPARSASRGVAAAITMAVHRFHTDGFTPYEGRLSVASNQQAIAQRFGPQRQFSATELEAYAHCPFRFWLQTGLGLEAVSPVEAGTDHRERGSLVHAVLSELAPDIAAGQAGEMLADRFRDLVSAQLQHAVTATELQRALTRVERQLLDQWAAAYAEQCAAYAGQIAAVVDDGWQVLETEFPFGDVPGARGENQTPPLTFGADAQRVHVRGRIDRIDVARVLNRPAYIVIDYKTGKRPRFSEDEVRSGQALQLMLYAIAVKRLGLAPVDAVPFQLGYWCLKETGFLGSGGSRTAQDLKPIDATVWQVLEQLVDEVVPRLAAGIRAGEFVVDNPEEHCTGLCEFRTACRVNQIRPLAERLHKFRRTPERSAPKPLQEPSQKTPQKGVR
jgi:ATP-dependent helicase/nuclease subunit B